jgi:hypothetical protein
MQGIGYIEIPIRGTKNKRKILLLARDGRTGRFFKVRRTGEDGAHFKDEEAYLASVEGRLALRRLEMGQTVPL